MFSKQSADKEEKDWEFERLRMVEGQLKSRGISDERVLKAMSKVPRHHFVPRDRAGSAYADEPIHIGQGQTVSNTYRVGIMTHCVRVKGDKK